MKKYLPILIAILLLKAAALVYFINSSQIGLSPDEAQYWTWSQFLDWGYYSKPPAIAWQIWLGTKLFGNSEIGVRFFSVVLSIFISLSVYSLAKAARLRDTVAFWSALAMAFSPLGILSSFLATTDVGLVLFWTLACVVMASALNRQKSPRYYVLGLIILLGALFKWPIYQFWLLVFAFIPFYRFLYTPHLWGGIAVSFLGLLPSVIWNWEHKWSTFRHVFATMRGGSSETENVGFLNGNFFDFLGAQAALASPLLFVFLLMGLFYLFTNRKRDQAGLLFCGIVSTVILIAYSVFALFHKTQGNWAILAYPTGFVVCCWYLYEKVSKGYLWFIAAISISIILSIFVFSIPTMQSEGILSEYQIPFKINSFKHNLGWETLKRQLSDAGYNENEHFLFGDKYQTSSILSFYSPGQKRAYFLNLHGIRNNQFSYWASMAEEQLGKTGYFVLTENQPHLDKNSQNDILFYKKVLQEYFSEVQFLGIKPLFYSYGQVAKGALIFKCTNYNGKEPPPSELY